jgi:hypothetical protein
MSPVEQHIRVDSAEKDVYFSILALSGHLRAASRFWDYKKGEGGSSLLIAVRWERLPKMPV